MASVNHAPPRGTLLDHTPGGLLSTAHAVRVLTKGFNILSRFYDGRTQAFRADMATLLLQCGRWAGGSQRLRQTNEVGAFLQVAVAADETREEGWYRLGRYHDELAQKYVEGEAIGLICYYYPFFFFGGVLLWFLNIFSLPRSVVVCFPHRVLEEDRGEMDRALQMERARGTTSSRGATGDSNEVEQRLQSSRRFLEHRHQAIGNFGLALKWGTEYLYHSMPRMLTLYFDDPKIVAMLNREGGGAPASSSSSSSSSSASAAPTRRGSRGASSVRSSGSSSSSSSSSRGNGGTGSAAQGRSRALSPASERTVQSFFASASQDPLDAEPRAHGTRIPREATPLHIYRATHQLVTGLVEALPAHLWYTSLSQILSRTAHDNNDVVKVILSVLVKVLSRYPQEASWPILSICESKDTTRRPRTERVVSMVIKGNHKLTSNVSALRTKIIENTLAMLKAMVEASRVDGRKTRAIRLDQVPKLRDALLAGENVLMPTQAALTARLVPGPTCGPLASRRPADVFPEATRVTFTPKFRNVLSVYTSLQRPRRLECTGSDGREYWFLLKAHDDLRKDQRMTELNTVVNLLLRRSPSCARRSLSLRTYAVLPLVENAGVLEMLRDTQSLRFTVSYHHRAIGARIHSDVIRDRYECGKNPGARAAAVSPHVDPERDADPVRRLNGIIAELPPVLHRWLLTRFGTPAAWLEARGRFTRSLAAWSMVGSIMGLGDRHGENVLLDMASGDVVNVDFGILFDQGRQLQVPELMPFRLTCNLVDALGVVGVEGPFRRACEDVMAVLRSSRATLTCVLETFLHDPLVEWFRTAQSRDNATPLEAKFSACRVLENVDKRLQGITERLVFA
jgi:hypothetical protein